MRLPLNNIYWRLMGPTLLVGALVIVFVGQAIPYFIEKNVEKTTKITAIELVDTLRSIRNFYNKTVVSKALKLDGVEVSHLHDRLVNGFPTPATFLMDMAAGKEGKDVLINVTSPYPFTHRKGRVLDEFQQTAWKRLSTNPTEVHTATNMREGQAYFRVAVSDTMIQKSCVSCHNSHSASTKTDWKLGDTRGIIEVQFNVTEQLASGQELSLFVILSFGVAIICLALFAHISALGLTRPLKSVTSSLRSLAEHGNCTRCPDLIKSNASEVRHLAHAFELFQDKEEERKQLASDIKRLAFFDTLTGLSNKTRFHNLLNLSLVPSDDLTCSVPMVVLLDIDQYRDINDTLGHKAGDEILRKIARRLEGLEEHPIHAARYGEDTFALLAFVPDGLAPIQYEQLTRQLCSIITRPFSHGNQSIRLTASYGISYAPDHGTTADALITAADVALGKAKAEGGKRVVVYSGTLAEQVQYRINIVNDLKEALRLDQLVPYFQPQYNLSTGELIGAEALIRWPQSDGSFIAPDVFIPIAEQAQLITQIGHYMIDRVCSYASEWKAAGLDVPKLAINISAIQFMQEDVSDTLKQSMEQYGIPAQLLEVEITESTMSEDVNLVIERMQAIQDMGVEVSLDDFGTGYSSLSYLQNIPLDRLKIDQSFVRDMMSHNQSEQIIKTIIALGRTMNLNVLAEGIETAEQGELLQKYGCLEGQGYGYARPMPPHIFVNFVEQKLAKQKQSTFISA